MLRLSAVSLATLNSLCAQFRPALENDDRHAPVVYVAGTGSYAAEIVEFAQAAGCAVAGLVELVDPLRVGLRIHDLDVIAAGDAPGTNALAAVAAGADRLSHWATLAANGWHPITVVHPTAWISPSAEIGPGCIIGPAAVVGARSTLAAQTLIGRGALIGHHVTIGAGAVINPGANVAGNVRIGEAATIGMGAIVINGVTVGDQATIAAGAVAVRDIAAGVRAQGVPAREYSKVILAE